MIIPIIIGSKKFKERCLFSNLKSRFVIIFTTFRSIFVKILIIFSYTPSIRAKVEPDNPGIIFAIPIKTPFKIFIKNSLKLWLYLMLLPNMQSNPLVD